MITIRVFLDTGYGTIEDEFEIKKETTEKEIAEIAEDFLENMRSEINGYWKCVD